MYYAHGYDRLNHTTTPSPWPYCIKLLSPSLRVVCVQLVTQGFLLAMESFCWEWLGLAHQTRQFPHREILYTVISLSGQTPTGEESLLQIPIRVSYCAIRRNKVGTGTCTKKAPHMFLMLCWSLTQRNIMDSSLGTRMDGSPTRCSPLYSQRLFRMVSYFPYEWVPAEKSE